MASGSHQKDGNTNSYNSSEAWRGKNVDEDDMDVDDKSSASDDDDALWAVFTGFNGAQLSVTSGGSKTNVIKPGNFQHKGASAGNTNSSSARSVSEAKDRTSSGAHSKPTHMEAASSPTGSESWDPKMVQNQQPELTLKEEQTTHTHMDVEDTEGKPLNMKQPQAGTLGPSPQEGDCWNTGQLSMSRIQDYFPATIQPKSPGEGVQMDLTGIVAPQATNERTYFDKEVIQPGWQKFEIALSGFVLDCSKELPPLEMQFYLHHFSSLVKDRVDEELQVKTTLKAIKERLVLLIQPDSIKDKQAFARKVVSILEKLTPHIQMEEIKLPDSTMVESAKGVISRCMESCNDRISVFEVGHRYFVVGRAEDMLHSYNSHVQNEIEKQFLHRKELKLTRHMIDNFDRMCLREQLKKRFPTLQITEQGGTGDVLTILLVGDFASVSGGEIFVQKMLHENMFYLDNVRVALLQYPETSHFISRAIEEKYSYNVPWRVLANEVRVCGIETESDVGAFQKMFVDNIRVIELLFLSPEVNVMSMKEFTEICAQHEGKFLKILTVNDGYIIVGVEPITKQILQLCDRHKKGVKKEGEQSFAQIKLTDPEPRILKCLQFEHLLEREYPNAKYEIDKSGWVQWHGYRDTDQWARLNSFLYDFLTKVFKCRHEIDFELPVDLLQRKEAHEFVVDRLKRQGISCFFHQTNRCKLEIFALNKESIMNGASVLKLSICCERFCKGDTTPNLAELEKNQEFQRLKKKFHNKFEIDEDDEEVYIVATADAAAAFRPCLYNKPKSVRKVEILPVSKGKMDWISLHRAQELENIQSNFGIKIQFNDLQGIVLEDEYPKQASSFYSATEAVRSLLTEVSEESVALQSDVSRERVEKVVERCSKQNNCVVVEEYPPCKNPMLRKCWLALPYKLDSLRIYFVQGSATRVVAEMLICPVNESMVPIGDCDIITRKGSLEIRKMLQNLQSNKDRYNDFHVEVHNETGDLPFHVIGYTVLPISDKMSEQKSNLRSGLDSAIKVAKSMNVKSIAVPVHMLPSSPLTDQASVIARFIHEMKQDCLQEIYICNTEEKGSLGIEKAIEKSFQNTKYQPLDFSKIHESAGVNGTERDNVDSPIFVTLGVGGYLRHQVDAFVNTTGRELDFSKGFISKLILEKAGASIQADCLRQQPDGIGFGDIVITGSGSLDCKNIIHGALPNWIPLGNFSLRVLKLFVYKCLEAAEVSKCSSLVFPSLGTGGLKYPWRLVAQEMLNAIHDYGKHNRDTCIKEVKLVMSDKDTQSIENFTAEISHRESEKMSKVIDEIPQMYMESWVPVGNDTVRMQILPKEPKQSWGCNMRVRISFSSKAQADKADEPKWCEMNSCFNLKIYVKSNTEDYFKLAVKKSLKMAADRRVTTMTLLLDDDKGNFLPLDKQSMCIKQAVFEYETSIKVYLYVHIVRLIFPSPDNLQLLMIETEEKRGKQSIGLIKSTFMTGMSLFSNANKAAPPWRIIRSTEQGEDSRHLTLWIYGLQKEVLHLKSLLQEEMQASKSNSDLQQKRDYEQWYTASFNNPSDMNALPAPTCRAISAQFHKGRTRADIRHPDKKDYLIIDFDKMTLHLSKDSTEKLLLINEEKPASELSQHPDNHVQNVEAAASPTLEIFSELKGHLNESLTEMLDENEELKSTIKQNCSVTLQKEKKGKQYALGARGFHHFLGGINEFVGTYKGESKGEKGNKDAQVGKASSSAKREEHVVNEDSYNNIETIQMSKTDYAVLCFFAERHQEFKEWWKACANKIDWSDGSLMFTKKDCSEDKVLKLRDYCKGLHQESFQLNENENISETGVKEIQDQLEDIYIERLSQTNIGMWSSGYESIQKAKHKVALKVGRIKDTGRRNRQFGAQNKQLPNLQVTQTQNSGKPSSPLPSPSSPSTDSGNLKTKEGLVVKVYTGNILRLDVDCIVNAANENLMHGGGIAAVISDNAGYEFGKESRDYVRLHGPLKVGESCTTSAGDLKYKCVVHTVGPRWNSSRKEQCLQELVTAVAGAIECADGKGMTSIAIPSISAGIFGMPKELCAMQYVEGVKQFSSVSWNPSRSSIKEVHFIDRDDSLVHIVRENFRRFLSTKTEDKASLKTSRQKRSFSNVPSPTETKPPVEISSETKKSGNYEFQPFKQLKVFLQVSNIVELSVDVITCPQDKKCEGRGAIAKAIYKKGSDHYKKNNTFSSPLTAGEVGAKVSKSPWKFVFHIVSPKNTRNTRSSGRKLEDELQECCLNLMKEANDLKAKSIAIPVLGIGEGGAVEVAETFARAAMSAILKFRVEELINLEEIYLVSNEEAVIDKMLPILCGEKKMGYKEMEVMPAQAAALSKTGKDFQQAAGMTIHWKQFENEDCCICMDKCTEPKRLRCGHVFCKECIDLQFKYKPACPQCGAVYGKVYGDQPDGTIRIMTSKRALEGYEGYGSIEVEYNIPPGKQLENHPNHGTDYEGIKRSGHLPNTDKGRLVCKLLNVAFTRKLVFTIGRSRTTGKDGVVTWNDIHHKTRREGGPQRFGYPDPTYLDRVLEELEVKGVTEELADDPSEYRIYTDAMRYY